MNTSTLKGWFITKNRPLLIRKISVNTLKYLILLLGAFASIFPLYWMFNIAVSRWEPLTWLPLNPHWENFIYAWNYMEDPPIWRALLNSTIVTVSRTLLVLFVSSLTAYALAIYKFKGRRLIFLWILTQVIFQGTISLMPGITNLIPMYVLMGWLGWVNTYWALIIPGVFSAYSIFLMRQYIITIPDDILDAARLSGCSEFGLYWRMILPLSKPALAAIGLVNAVWVWNDLLWPTLMIKNTQWYTVQQALNGLFDMRESAQYLNVVAGCITIASIPLIVITILTQKYIIQGWTGLSYAKR